jgi:ATP-binding cassette subfamily B protein
MHLINPFVSESVSTRKGIMTGITKEFDPNGVIFFGGQAQKLALARAFAKNGSIHIFDEPSSALDPIAENELFENMIKVAKDKTLILYLIDYHQLY